MLEREVLHGYRICDLSFRARIGKIKQFPRLLFLFASVAFTSVPIVQMTVDGLGVDRFEALLLELLMASFFV